MARFLDEEIFSVLFEFKFCTVAKKSSLMYFTLIFQILLVFFFLENKSFLIEQCLLLD